MSKVGEEEKLTKATKVKIGVAVGVLVLAAVILVVVLSGKEKSYRTIAVEQVHGTALVSSDGAEAVNAYEGMHLYSGDDVAVQQESDMTMVLDMDKYVYAEPSTHFWLECEGTEDNSKTVIFMDNGSTLNHIKDNLNEGEVYKVDTPNSTMAVRGTVFRVTVYAGEDGLIYTLLEVFEGSVQVDLKTEDGKYNGVSETFGPGESALIRGNSEFSEFVRDGEIQWIETKTDTIILPIAYKEIPQDTAKVLVKIIEEGTELSIDKELLMDYTKLADHKMITREGKESTCTEAGYEEVWCQVCNEVTEIVELPLLDHKVGEWEVVRESSCEEAGIRQKTCSICGTVCVEEELKALGHHMGEIKTVTNATCTENGEQIGYCKDCEAQMQHVVVNALGHTQGDAVKVKAETCTEAGIIQIKCSACGIVMSEQSISGKGHSWGSWQTSSQATCTTQGVESRVCSRCGTTETQGTGGGSHSWSWRTTSEASCDEAGERIGTCSLCKTTQTKKIAAKGHSMVWIQDPDRVATCQTEGWENEECSVCGTLGEGRSTGFADHDLAHRHGDIIQGNDGIDMVTCFEYCMNCEYEGEPREKVISIINDMPYCECGELLAE